MIKINLLTEKKRGPSINIGLGVIFPFIIIIAAIALTAGLYLYGQTVMADWNNDLIEKKKEVENEISQKSSKQKVLTELKKTIARLEDEKDTYSRISGLEYLQWSDSLKTLTDLIPETNVWITNLRIDSDRRVQLTAYSCNDEGKDIPKDGNANLTKGIQTFLSKLVTSQIYIEPFLNNATKNVYEKKPVWRFEINCRLLENKIAKD